jgi:hypothetical protein
MKDFLKSLSKTQQQGLVDLIKDNSKHLESIAYALEENLAGNSDSYNYITGGTGKKSDQDQDADVAHPAIAAYLKRKLAEEARQRS